MAEIDFSISSIRKDLGEGTFSIQEFYKNLLARCDRIASDYNLPLKLFRSDAIRRVEFLDIYRREGNIIGNIFGVPFAISADLLENNLGREYNEYSKVPLIRRLLVEGAVLLCKLEINQNNLFIKLQKEVSENSEFHFQEKLDKLNPISLAVLFGLVPIGFTCMRSEEWLNELSFSNIIAYSPSREIIPYTGIRCENKEHERLILLGRSIEDLGKLCEELSGDDGVDTETLGVFKKRIVKNRAEQKKIGKRVLLIKSDSKDVPQYSDYFDSISNKLEQKGMILDTMDILDVFKKTRIKKKGEKNKIENVTEKTSFDFSTISSYAFEIFKTCDVVLFLLSPTSCKYDDLFKSFFQCRNFPLLSVPVLIKQKSDILKIKFFFVGMEKRDDILLQCGQRILEDLR